MLRFKISVLASLLFTLFVCNVADAQVFYKVSGKDLEKPSYILGTHHLAPLSFLDSIATMPDAFDSVEQIIPEIDMTQDQMVMASAMQPYMMAPADSTLSAVLGKSKFDALSKKFTNEVGFPLQVFDALRPMVPMTLYTVKVMSNLMPGYNPEEQLDSYFQKEGKLRGMIISPLEQLEEQAELLYTTLSVAQQAEELEKTLDDPAKLVESAKNLNEKYLSGDIDALYEACLEENSHPEFFDKLTRNRNIKWMTKIPDLITKHPSLIVVGAAHLCGDTGLLAALKNLGYNVEPLK